MTTTADKLTEARRKRQEARKRGRPSIVPLSLNDADQFNVEDAPYYRRDPFIEPAYLDKLHTNYRIVPRSLDEVLALSADDVADCDLARLNMLCATGLRRAEGLDVNEYVDRLDRWAAYIGMMTDHYKHVFDANPARYEHSEPLWRMLVLTRVLERAFGVRYNPDRLDIPDWTDSQDMLIHGLLGPQRTGTCPSIPVLLVVLGQRLGYPLKLVRTQAHLFSRWDALDHLNPNFRERFNGEFHGNGFIAHSDTFYYKWPVALKPSQIARYESGDPNAPFLNSLNPAQAFAEAISCRAVVLNATGHHTEAYNTFQVAHRFDPHYGGYREQAECALRARAELQMKALGFEPRVFRGMLDQWHHRLKGKLYEKIIRQKNLALAEPPQPQAFQDGLTLHTPSSMRVFVSGRQVAGSPQPDHQHTQSPSPFYLHGKGWMKMTSTGPVPHRLRPARQPATHKVRSPYTPSVPENFATFIDLVLMHTVAGTDAEPTLDLLKPVPVDDMRRPDDDLPDPDQPFKSIITTLPDPDTAV